MGALQTHNDKLRRRWYEIAMSASGIYTIEVMPIIRSNDQTSPCVSCYMYNGHRVCIVIMSHYVGAHASSLPRLSLNLQPRVHGDLKKTETHYVCVRVCVFVRLVRHIIRRPPPHL